jgi:hypothetical protein
MDDPYRVLPHRNIVVASSRRLYADGERACIEYWHRPCAMRLSEADVKEANWCHHCAAVINKAAKRRGEADRWG